MIMLLVVHFLLGFRRLRGLDYFKNDPMVARTIGISCIPDVSTVLRTLSKADKRRVQNVRELSRGMVTERLMNENFSCITIDFDGSVQSTNGKVEGSAVGYNKKKKGARSYWPLFCTVAQTGQIYDMHHRPGNIHDSNGAPGFMEDCINDVQTNVKPDLLEARIDSAFYNENVLPLLNKKNVEFTCSVPFEKFTELKGIIEARRRWNRIDEKISYFECDWKPKSWKNTDRIIFIRNRRPVRFKGSLQLDLFEPKDFEFEYKVIATNKSDSAKNVLLFHNGRGEQEGIFAEAKQHVALDLIPTKKLLPNQLYTLSCKLAHNLTRELQMRTRPVDRELLPKRPSRWEFQELGTIRQRILHLAGRLTRPQGELTLSVNYNRTEKKEIEQYLKSLKRVWF